MGDLMLSRHTAALVLAALAFSPTSLFGQDSRTTALAKELTALLDAAKTDCAAARMIGSQDEFVAALYFPGSQLLVISAKYAAPALLNERLLQRNFKEVYLDLNAATDPATRLVIEDLHADGIRPKNAEDDPPDYYSKGTEPRVQFDGQWKKRKLQEADYMKSFAEADALYTRMLESLIAEFKKAS